MDLSFIQADASNNSVANKESIERYLNKSYQVLESRLEEEKSSFVDDENNKQKNGIANQKYVSTTDPDASGIRQGKGKSKLKYQVHRGLDGKK
jgi:DNA-binding protein H-NS